MASLLPSIAAAKPSETPFSIEPGSFEVTPSTYQAGAHPDLTIAFNFAHSADERTFNDVKDTEIQLPTGFAGAPSAVPTCTDAQLLLVSEAQKPECPLASQLGTITVDFIIATASPAKMTLPLFNMEPTGANASAELGFRGFVFSQLAPMRLRSQDGGLSVSIPDTPLFAEVSKVSITIWGSPASPSHDPQRGQECLPQGIVEGEQSCVGGGNPAGIAVRPFLDNPTRCGAATARIEADSWEEPERWSEAEAEAGPIGECEQVPFEPSAEVRPTSGEADSPIGLDLSIVEPQNRDDPEAPASSSLAEASVALPEGLTVDPAAAAGLGVCTPRELEREVAGEDGGCPPESKIGSAEIETPLLEEVAGGSVYLAKPFDNSLGSLFAFYFVARVPGGGFVKLTGRLLPDQHSGLLRFSLDKVPQLPLSRIALRLPGGADSLFVTPPACGTYAAEAELTPSSDPAAPWQGSSSFEIDRGAGGASCPPAGGLPFHSGFTATSPRKPAGAFSTLDLRLTREPGEAPFAGISLELPPGMVANLAAVAPCPEAALAAIALESGTEERAEPSCPADSEIGQVSLGVGAGSRLARVGGSAYLAGPYLGSARSIAFVVPGLLGPFDLGTVVMREKLRVDPRTGEVSIGSAGSDPIPQLLDGIPLRLRELDVNLDRRRLLRNPTSCRPLSLTAGVTAPDAGLAAAAQPLSTLSVPFRATSCRRLRFAPRLGLRFLGALHRNGHPGFRLGLDSGLGESGLASAAIDLPPTELLDSGHIHGICTRPRFAAGHCPATSVYGYARASTPFLAEPLRGHVYLRATKHGLPSLAAALRSREMSLDFVARLKATRGGLRIAPESVPDVPVSKLVLEVRGGRRGLLVNSVDLCAGRLHARARFSAQNGKRHKLRLPLHVSCHPHGGGTDRGGMSKKTLGTR